jgi:glycosyltransferase involved in cell wall biosynthesis
LLLHRRPTVVVSEPPPTTGLAVRLACLLRRIPYVYYAADLWSEALHEVGSPALVRAGLRQVESMAMRGAAAVVTVNDTYVSRLERLGVALSNITVVGNGTDTRVFRLLGLQPDFGPPYLVYAGTASEVHGASLIVEAMPLVLAALPEARLVVIGQGLERDSMERAARQLPAGAVRFFPRLDGETTAGWLRGARAALASVRPGPYEFTVATKMYAAVACGTPVLYIGDGGPGAAAVREGTLGDVVPYEVHALAELMVRTLKTSVEPAERERLALWAHERASLQACAARVVDVVDGVRRR